MEFVSILLVVAGGGLVLIAYHHLTSGNYTAKDSQYHILNLSGGVLLTISLMYHFNLGSFIIEIFWMAISIKGIINSKKTNKEV